MTPKICNNVFQKAFVIMRFKMRFNAKNPFQWLISPLRLHYFALDDVAKCIFCLVTPFLYAVAPILALLHISIFIS